MPTKTELALEQTQQDVSYEVSGCIEGVEELIMPTKTELALEQTQQDVSYEVSGCIEGVEELKRNVRIKGVKKEALHTLRQKPEHQSDTKVFTVTMEILPEPTSNKLCGILDDGSN
ncbi:hypothetical protein Tco_0771950 [Tanacetum coccineum]|uniref:Uncharacterized protein n=1 Tax=Tanacetum coccineum TaxID=301880 RepID=A0ABQ4ZGJ6_9ASTR